MAKIKKYKPYLEIFPVVLILSFVFLVGIFGAFIQSLGYFPIIGMKELSFKFYMNIFKNANFLKSLAFTLYITLASSVVSVILGLLISRSIVEFESGLNLKKNRIDIFYKIPIVVPHITVALFAITFLSDSGIISRILYTIGFKNSQELFSNLLFSPNGLGIVLSYIWKETPYVLLSTLAILRKISVKHEMVARNLGASKISAFCKITIPMLLPTISSTFTIIFAFSFGSYEIPILLGSTVPKALPVQAFIEYQNPMLTDRPSAMAMNMIIIFFCLVFVLLFNYVIKYIILGRNIKNLK